MEKTTEDFKNDPPLLPRASGVPIPDPQEKEKSGIPDGYKPDTSVKFVKGKNDDGSDGTIQKEDGTQTSVTDQRSGTTVPVALPPGHTYEDRIRDQARRMGIPVLDGETTELLMWKIRMQASS